MIGRLGRQTLFLKVSAIDLDVKFVRFDKLF